MIHQHPQASREVTAAIPETRPGRPTRFPGLAAACGAGGVVVVQPDAAATFESYDREWGANMRKVDEAQRHNL